MFRPLEEVVGQAVQDHTEIATRICRCGHIEAKTPWGPAMAEHVSKEITAAVYAAGYGYEHDTIKDAADSLPLFSGRATAALYLHNMAEQLHARTEEK